MPMRRPALSAASNIASFGFSTGMVLAAAAASIASPKAEQVKRMPAAPVPAAYPASTPMRRVIAAVSFAVALAVDAERGVEQIGALGLGPQPRERLVHRRHRDGDRMNEGDAHHPGARSAVGENAWAMPQ